MSPHAAHQRNGTGRMLGAAFGHRQDASSSAINFEGPEAKQTDISDGTPN